jgi:hypothetical protein
MTLEWIDAGHTYPQYLLHGQDAVDNQAVDQEAAIDLIAAGNTDGAIVTGTLEELREVHRRFGIALDQLAERCDPDWGSAPMAQLLREEIPTLYEVSDVEAEVETMVNDGRWNTVIKEAVAAKEATAVIAYMHDYAAEENWGKRQ